MIKPTDIQGQRGCDSYTAILGMGATGLSVARFFSARDIDFTWADTRQPPPALAEVKSLYPNHPIRLGTCHDLLFEGVETIVVSPGIALDDPVLAAAKSRGIRLIGDLELFYQQADAPVVAITGSNGKSTVTTLLGEMARNSDIRVRVGGNLGTPALDLLASDCELYVLELSSFQLELFPGAFNQVCTILNVSPDHLDRYGDFQTYLTAKQRIFTGAEYAVVNRRDAFTYPEEASAVKRVSFGADIPCDGHFGVGMVDGQTWLMQARQGLMPAAEIALEGRHNIDNALAALALGTCIGLPIPAMLATLKDFSGLPHRCQKVACIEGVMYIDDSKATNVGAVCAAVEGFADGDKKNIVLIAGGRAKGEDFAMLANAVEPAVKHSFLIGEMAPHLRDILHPTTPSTCLPTLEDCVKAARDLAEKGDVVLLSPACTSFDMFDDFAHRGRCFQAAVHRLYPAASCSEHL